MKILLLTPEPIDAGLLRSAAGDELEGAEVLVVSPATNESKLAFWVSDPDEAIAEAETAQVDTVFVAGRKVKDRGRLTYGEESLERRKRELAESRRRIMEKGRFVYVE